MYLVLVIVMLLVYGVYALIQHCRPSQPPIENMDAHLKELMQLPNAKARQKYLKQCAKHKQ